MSETQGSFYTFCVFLIALSSGLSGLTAQTAWADSDRLPLPDQDQVARGFKEAYQKIRKDPSKAKEALQSISPALKAQNEAIRAAREERDRKATEDLISRLGLDRKGVRSASQNSTSASQSSSAPQESSVSQTSLTVDSSGIPTEIDFGPEGSDVKAKPQDGADVLVFEKPKPSPSPTLKPQRPRPPGQ